VFLSALSALQLAQPGLLASLELLDRVAEKGWLPSTSQLEPLLRLKSLNEKEFSCYEFTFIEVGWNESGNAWQVGKGG
jgi:hypothetical protein